MLFVVISFSPDFPFSGLLFQYSQGDKSLTGVSHIIVDEVHERSLLVSG